MIKKKYNSGFTLVELIVVMTLISMMLSVTLPRLQGALFSGGTKQAFRTIILKIKALKENAVIDQRTYTLHVDMDNDTLWMSHDAMTEEELLRERENQVKLSDGLIIVDVEYPGEGLMSQGEVEIGFYKKGYSDTAIIHLSDGGDEYYSFFIESFLSGTKLINGYFRFGN
ncbi:MAG: type II secretion system GspH family protein [Proteobacteria bacterium]|nr:type II secretion system GspH family protein [Pseudomonadota bacterium]